MRGLILGLTLIAGSVSAQDCASIGDDASRLACFDAVVEPTACEVEDWLWSYEGDAIDYSGATTCGEGTIRIRFYDAGTQPATFLGATFSYVRGYSFRDFMTSAAPTGDVTIRYTIEER